MEIRLNVALPLLSILIAATPLSGSAQSLPSELEPAAEAARLIQVLGPSAPDAIWPGFRPDTLAVLFSVPEVGWFLSGWVGELPADFVPYSGVRGAGWRPYRPGAPDEENQVSLDGRPWIFYRSYQDPATDLGNGVHEAFHLLQRALRDAGRYPPGENSFLVTSYPEFDAVNEAGLALEGRLLEAAIAALPDTSAAHARVREFVAAREARQRARSTSVALFESSTELNEGVAQYTYIRALELASADPDLPWKGAAESEVRAQLQRLDEVLDPSQRSSRLRFYASGAAQALLLDALLGPRWKERVMEDGTHLQDLLAEATGYRAAETALVAAARRAHGPDLADRAAEAVKDLRARRLRRAEEALAAPGVRIELNAAALPGGDIGFCGIDPQNLLQLSEERLLHARWLRACGPGLNAEFQTEVVHDRATGHLRAVIGREEEVSVSEDGERVTIDAPGLALTADRARLERRDGTIFVTVLGAASP